MPRHLRWAFGGVVIAGLGACGVPTDLADWDMTWSVPTNGTTISVNSLLPSGVSAVGNGFSVSIAPTTISRRLGDDCSACAAADGLTVPKPAFVGSGTTTASLPASVNSATLGANQLTITLRHAFGFDPLRPSAQARGWLRLVATSNGVVIGRDSVNGATTAFGAGVDLVRSIALSGTVTRGGVTVTSTLDSPAGDAARMQSSAAFTATAAFTSLTISGAQVTLTNQTIASSPTTLDLRDVGDAVRNRAASGVLQLTIANPFAATGQLTLTFTGGDRPITKAVTLASGTATQDVPLSRADLQALFGKSIALTASGPVNGSAVTITPGQSVTVSSRLLLTLNRESQP